jgi:hypothetical protein
MTYVSFASHLSAILTVATGLLILYYWRRTALAGVSYLRYYFLLAALIEIVMYYYYYLGINNLALANVFCMLRYFPLAMTFVHWGLAKEWHRAGMAVNLVATLIFAGFILAGDLHRMNSSVFSLQNLLFAIMAALTLFRITGDYSRYLTENHRFWFSVGVFLYFSVGTVMFATANIMLDNQQVVGFYTWIINSIMTITANLLFIKGILCLPVTKR